MPRLRRRRWPWAGGAAALAALIVADQNGWLLVRGPDDMIAYHGARGAVTRVIEGDLIEVAIPDRLHGRPHTQVRLWGVKCPRGAGIGHAAEPMADEARELTRMLAQGETVMLSLEPHRTRAELDRVLAHVELPGGSSLNESLLAAGLARIDDRIPHSLLGRHEQLQQIAKRQQLGVWAGPQ